MFVQFIPLFFKFKKIDVKNITWLLYLLVYNTKNVSNIGFYLLIFIIITSNKGSCKIINICLFRTFRLDTEQIKNVTTHILQYIFRK